MLLIIVCKNVNKQYVKKSLFGGGGLVFFKIGWRFHKWQTDAATVFITYVVVLLSGLDEFIMSPGF
jgi:hypothetical protein